jgi:GNAT superfamily N-acetyltransferase
VKGGRLSRSATRPVVTIRPYAHSDQTAVLELLTATLGGGPAGQRPPGLFRWKHFESPFGSSFMLVAEADGRIIGLRAFLRWQLQGPGGPVAAVRAVDTATHPDYQGIGVFSRLTRSALQELEGEVDLVFNTPNGASGPGYLKLGWQAVGRVPVAIRVRRPVAFVLGLRGSSRRPQGSPEVAAEPAAQVFERGDEVAGLLAELPVDGNRVRTRRDLRYLRWRYGAAPLLDYRAVVEQAGGRLQGLAIFRVRPRRGLWEATVAEVMVPAGDRRTARRLLGGIARAAPVDHLTLHVPAWLGGAAAGRAGFLPAPEGISLLIKPLRQGLDPDPTTLRSWSLSLGDLEVF